MALQFWEKAERKIRQRKQEYKSEKQKKIKNSFYKAQEKVIALINDFAAIAPKVKRKAKHEQRLKILTPKQMFQRLPMDLAQVKAGNTSEIY